MKSRGILPTCRLLSKRYWDVPEIWALDQAELGPLWRVGPGTTKDGIIHSLSVMSTLQHQYITDP
jgi:hypothetical protein